MNLEGNTAFLSFRESQLELQRSFEYDSEEDAIRGPGRYNLVPILGRKKIESSQPNSPAFSFPHQINKKKNLVPGVGTYSTEKTAIQTNLPQFSIGKEKKFFIHESMIDYKKQV